MSYKEAILYLGKQGLQYSDCLKEPAGISYSTLKHETTVTTDSVLNEERLIQS